MNRVQKIKKLKAGFKFYKNSFGLHPPYLILCDSNFLYAVVDSKIPLEETFKSVFKGQIYLKVSDCALHELNLLKAPKTSETKRFAYNKCQKFVCSHPPKKPNQCIYQALRQGFQGCVCTQDSDLRRKIHRDFPKIPIFFVSNQSLIILPPPKSLKEKIKNDLIAKYAPQALKKENAHLQQNIEIDDNDMIFEEEEEEEEEEINEEINEDQQVINGNNANTDQFDDTDVLQNIEEKGREQNKNEQDESQSNDADITKTKKKRKHKHSEDNETINYAKQKTIENDKTIQTLEDVPTIEDKKIDTENNDTKNKKHRKHHHRSTQEHED